MKVPLCDATHVKVVGPEIQAKLKKWLSETLEDGRDTAERRRYLDFFLATLTGCEQKALEDRRAKEQVRHFNSLDKDGIFWVSQRQNSLAVDRRVWIVTLKSSKHRKLPFPWTIEQTDFSPSEPCEKAYQAWTNFRQLSGWPPRIGDDKGIAFLRKNYEHLWCMDKPAELPTPAIYDQNQAPVTKRLAADKDYMETTSHAEGSTAQAGEAMEVDSVVPANASNVPSNSRHDDIGGYTPHLADNLGKHSPSVTNYALDVALNNMVGVEVSVPVYNYEHLDLLGTGPDLDHFAKELCALDGGDVFARRRYIHRYLQVVSKSLDYRTAQAHKAHAQVHYFDSLAQQGREWVSKRYNSLMVDFNSWHRSFDYAGKKSPPFPWYIHPNEPEEERLPVYEEWASRYKITGRARVARDGIDWLDERGHEELWYTHIPRTTRTNSVAIRTESLQPDRLPDPCPPIGPKAQRERIQQRGYRQRW